MPAVPLRQRPHQPDPGKRDQVDPIVEMRRLAEEGDVPGLIECLNHVPLGTYRATGLDALLRRAVARAGQQSPDRFSDGVFKQLIGFTMYVFSRFEICAFDRIATSDRDSRGTLAQLPLGLPEEFLPHAAMLARLLGELLQAWASTTRMRALAARSERRRGVVRGKRHRAKPRGYTFEAE